ncbi:MAG: hypothetical protein JWQ42_4093, partial [Edaphobacter sp.]|nr:hypothetical protein [Edaphobacter sp.]
MFQNYLSYSALAGTDDEAVAGGFNDRSRDDMKVIHAENSLDRSEEPSQKSEISAAHPNEARYHFRNELLVREDNAGRCPSFFKQFLDLRRVERTELMYESNARVELRKTSDPLLYARHAYEHHAGRALVKDGSHLFETVHLEAIGLIHQDQGGRISYCSLFRSI